MEIFPGRHVLIILQNTINCFQCCKLQAMPQIHDLPLEDLQPSQKANARYEETFEGRDELDNRGIRCRELSSKVGPIMWSMKLIVMYWCAMVTAK